MHTELVKLLQTLVAIPSVNPALANDPAVGGEARMAAFVSDYLKHRGFRIETLELIPGRPNIVGRFGLANPKRRILIEGHTDTQGIHGMTVKPFGAEIHGTRLYGRGACDTKGPTAAALHALAPDVLAKTSAAGIEIIYVAAIGEERGNVGAEQLVDAGLVADEALVLEPTDLQIVHAHKGTFWFEIEIHGTAAHGSQPETGVNAIYGAAKAIDALLKISNEEHSQKTNALLGKATTNVGVIRGGSSINIVPDRCVIEVDCRSLPGDDTSGFLVKLRDALRILQTEGAFTNFDVRLIKESSPYETAADSPMISRLKAAVAASGGSPASCGVGWYSDAGPLSRIATHVAVFGPGSIAQAHTCDEYIEIDSLEKGSAIIRDYLLRSAEAL